MSSNTPPRSKRSRRSCRSARQLLEHLAETLDAFAVAIVEAVLQHAPKRSVEIAVVEQIVGQLLHDVGRIELEAPLRAVPG